jgi:hypothetical protein
MKMTMSLFHGLIPGKKKVKTEGFLMRGIKAFLRDVYSLAHYKKALAEVGLWKFRGLAIEKDSSLSRPWWKRKMKALVQLCLLYVAFWSALFVSILTGGVLSLVLVGVQGDFLKLLQNLSSQVGQK